MEYEIKKSSTLFIENEEKKIDWLVFILHMKMKVGKRNSWIPENELAKRLTRFHITYENEGR